MFFVQYSYYAERFPSVPPATYFSHALAATDSARPIQTAAAAITRELLVPLTERQRRPILIAIALPP
jgi:hypothetical protein